jgi:hypothetical protein
MTHICADIADPAGWIAPSWVDTVQGYVGERVPIRTPTPHIWTAADWWRFRGFHKYPMFVATVAVGMPSDPVTEAFECLENLYQIGLPAGKVVGLDMEETADARYCEEFYGVLHRFGYRVWVYGSISTIFGNPPLDGYDVADWTGTQHYAGHAKVRATQYADAAQSGIGADLRVIRPWQWQFNLWG